MCHIGQRSIQSEWHYNILHREGKSLTATRTARLNTLLRTMALMRLAVVARDNADIRIWSFQL